MSLQLYTGTNIAKQLQGNNLLVIEGANVTVIDVSTGLTALLFSDKLGTIPLLNPFVADSTGQFYFYVIGGRYNITIAKGANSGQIYAEIGTSGEVTTEEITTDAFTITSANHGTMFKVYDITGSVGITVDQVAAEDNALVFIKRMTDAPIQFIAGAGVTIETAYSLNVWAKFSIVALMSDGLNTWSLVGDLEP